jgi:hypothetical protein
LAPPSGWVSYEIEGERVCGDIYGRLSGRKSEKCNKPRSRAIKSLSFRWGFNCIIFVAFEMLLIYLKASRGGSEK